MTVSSAVSIRSERLASWIRRRWYASQPSCTLRSFGRLYAAVMGLRRHAYGCGLLASYSVEAQVIVVGNIDVGGNGKTPLTICLAELLSDRGWRVGVVSRGYGGSGAVSGRPYPLDVSPATDTAHAGDEPVLISQRTDAAVVVDPDRVRGARRLVDAFGVDIVLADDGLQHLRLQRAYEIALLDAERGLGNRCCLPAGPLREPPERLTTVDRVLTQGATHDFMLVAGQAQNIASGGYAGLDTFRQCSVVAVAGIAHPQRFFSMLRVAGIDFTPYQPGDHAPVPSALLNDNRPILMTEKDAVKWPSANGNNAWVIPVRAQLAPVVRSELLASFEALVTHDTR